MVTRPNNTHAPQNTTVAIYLNACLLRAGIKPAVKPLNASDPSAGPSQRPVTLDQLHVVCIDGQKQDCSSELSGRFSTSLGWSVLSAQYQPAAKRTFAPSTSNVGDAHAGHQAATIGIASVGIASMSSELLPLGVPDSDMQPRWLHLQRDVE